jgi:hypothetical protein
MDISINLTMTLAEIREHRPCERGWKTLRANIGGARAPLATRVSLGDIAHSNGAADAWWGIRALDWSDETVRRQVVSVLLLTVRRAAAHTTDERVHASVDAIQRWCDGDDSVDLKATRAAARAAWAAAWTAEAWAAADAARAARAAADAAAAEAVWTAEAAARAAADAADAAREAAWAAVAEADAAAAAARAETEQQRADLIAAFPPLHI